MSTFIKVQRFYIEDLKPIHQATVEKSSTHHREENLPVQCQSAVEMNRLHSFQLADIIWPVTFSLKNIC